MVIHIVPNNASSAFLWYKMYYRQYINYRRVILTNTAVSVIKDRLVDSVFLSMRNAALLVCALKNKLTRIRDGGIGEEDIVEGGFVLA
jgi:hypothetical protein